MKKRTLTLLSIAFALSLVACSPESGRLVAPPVQPEVIVPIVPEVIKPITLTTDGLDVDFNPRVDILFVIDNSTSMDIHQKRLSDNIELFVDEFAKNKLVDFHIGVVSVYDHKTYADRPEKTFPLGKLRPIKNAQGEDLLDRPPFIERSKGFLNQLKSTLKIGTVKVKDGGSEFEESFSPVIAALSEPNLSAENAGFYRQDAHLAVIFITDADDQTRDTTGEQLLAFATDLKGSASKVSFYGVISPLGENTCKKDPVGAPLKMTEFLLKTNSPIISLCDKKYGEKLSEIGADINRRTVEKTIVLPYIPDFAYNENTCGKPICVDYGRQNIPQDQKIGWTYNAQQVAIKLNAGVNVEADASAKITIRYLPVNPHKKSRTVIINEKVTPGK